MNIKISEIMNYEKQKIQFCKENNLDYNLVLSDEYASYEELKYGEKLSSIYVKLDELRDGKETLLDIGSQITNYLFVYLIYISLSRVFGFNNLFTDILALGCIITLVLKHYIYIKKDAKLCECMEYEYKRKKILLKNKIIRK